MLGPESEQDNARDIEARGAEEAIEDLEPDEQQGDAVKGGFQATKQTDASSAQLFVTSGGKYPPR
jgi:hypothetical protein